MQKHYNKVETLEVMHGGFIVRLAAFMIDSLIIGAFSLMIKLPFSVIALFVTEPFYLQNFLFHFSILDVLLYLIGVIYFVAFTYCTSTTIGKRIMNLRVISTTGHELNLLQVIYRETVGKYLSAVIFSIGYLLIIVDKEKKALHDRLADTKVIYSKRIRVDSYYKKEIEE